MANWLLKVGETVTLSPDHKWDESEDNPVGVTGVVKFFDDDGEVGQVNVEWSNGGFNSYHICDSDLIAMEGEQ